MTLTKDITSDTSIPPIQSSRQGDGNKNLLDLSPNDVVFYVGGYPANFTVSKSEQKKKKRPLPQHCVSAFNQLWL